jgi:ankyrin repeat protein
LEKTKALIKEHPESVNSQSSYGDEAPLHLAVEYGHKDVAELLLANKADVTRPMSKPGPMVAGRLCSTRYLEATRTWWNCS